MGIKDFVLMGGFTVIAIFGYYIVCRFDHFLDNTRQKDEEQEQTTCLNIATSCFNAIPAVADIIKDIKYLYPNVHCNLSVGHEQEVIKSFDMGEADVAIISADSSVESGKSAQWKCITLDTQFFPVDNGIVEVKTAEKKPHNQKVLWRSCDDQSLAGRFIYYLCGQRP